MVRGVFELAASRKTAKNAIKEIEGGNGRAFFSPST
jgi:hypothetical protein